MILNTVSQEQFKTVEANIKPNLIPFPYPTESGTVKAGVTFSFSNDGIVTLNGKSSNTDTSAFSIVYRNFSFVAGKKYTMSIGSNVVGSQIYVNVVTYNGGTLSHIHSIASGESSISFVAEANDKDVEIWVHAMANVQISNLKLKPMLIEGDVAPTEYKMRGDFACVGTLASGQTTLELTSDRITTSSVIERYFYVADGTETEPVSYNTIKVENGKVTMTFDALGYDLNVGIRVM